MPAPVITDSVTDFLGIAKLRADARADAKSPAVLRKVASQFEAIFVQMMLKGMREAKLADGMFDSNQQDHYLDMFDSQIALNLSQGRGIGLADLLVRQLGGTEESAASVAASAVAGGARSRERMSPQDFVRAVWPHAQRAAETLGADPKALVAQAALETGWGKSIISRPDGGSSHNLFGIKAGAGWEGERVSVGTLEFEDGVAVRKRADFRAYDSFADSFQDYARLLSTQPRYQGALTQADDPAAFAHALQQAGYATDPAYARKIEGILGGNVLASALAGLKHSATGTLT